MTSRLSIKIVALLLSVVLVAPSMFLISPPVAEAQSIFNVSSVPVGDWIDTIQNTITAVAAPISAAANVATQINQYVLQPLAFVLSGNLVKLLTAGVIAFVIGRANGTGVPQFVVDVNRSMRTVADSQALAYLRQIGQTNSPFASSVSSAIKTDYLSKTSLAGFWTANMNTLAASSPNVPAYLAGNWSQGGVAEWFALTTQVQNNPYTLYQNSQAQLSNVVGPGVGGATGARLAELNWGQGFLSWCGPSSSAAPSGSSSTGVNPGDPCRDKNGKPGTIQTPGSTIKATLDKVLGGQQDQIVRMGNIGPEINGILGNIATVMQTVNFASSILGGNSSSGGLLGVGNTTGGNSTSRLSQFQNSPGALGITNAQIYQQAATLPSSGSDMKGRVTNFQAAWDAIAAAANTASSSVSSLATFCLNAASSTTISNNPTFVNAVTTQVSAARTALTTEIAPVLSQASAAAAITAAATAMIQKTQTDLNSTTGTAGAAYTADMQTLQTMPPTALDVATAQGNARAMGAAVATPPGSLTVASTSSSIVDQMNLISSNATALKASVCTPK